MKNQIFETGDKFQRKRTKLVSQFHKNAALPGRGRGFKKAVSAAVKTELEKIQKDRESKVSALTEVCKSAVSAAKVNFASTSAAKTNSAPAKGDVEAFLNQKISSLLTEKGISE